MARHRASGAHRRVAGAGRRHGKAVVATMTVAAAAVGGTGALVLAGQPSAAKADSTRPSSTHDVAPAALDGQLAGFGGSGPTGAGAAVPVAGFLSVEMPDASVHDLDLLKKADQIALRAMNEPGAPYEAADGSGLNGWIAKSLGILGLPQSLAPGVKKIIMAESGGNPRAINRTDSNAKAGRPSQGLMQLIPQTFRAYCLPALRERSITDPVANITAGLRYMIQNYGLDTVRAGGRHTSSGSYRAY